MDERENLLRGLVLHDDGVIASVVGLGKRAQGGISCIDARTHALSRLGALIALGAPDVAYHSCVTMALAAGATADEIIDTLVAVAPLIGGARVVAAAPALAMAIGYDIDSALESFD